MRLLSVYKAIIIVVNDMKNRTSENSKLTILKSLYETKSFYDKEIIDTIKFDREFIEEELFLIYLNNLNINENDST